MLIIAALSPRYAASLLSPFLRIPIRSARVYITERLISPSGLPGPRARSRPGGTVECNKSRPFLLLAGVLARAGADRPRFRRFPGTLPAKVRIGTQTRCQTPGAGGTGGKRGRRVAEETFAEKRHCQPRPRKKGG